MRDNKYAIVYNLKRNNRPEFRYFKWLGQKHKSILDNDIEIACKGRLKALEMVMELNAEITSLYYKHTLSSVFDSKFFRLGYKGAYASEQSFRTTFSTFFMEAQQVSFTKIRQKRIVLRNLNENNR